MFVWMDEWIDKTMEDMRHLEEETRVKLVEQRATAGIRGAVEHMLLCSLYRVCT